jgi:hypothetical protein
MLLPFAGPMCKIAHSGIRRRDRARGAAAEPWPAAWPGAAAQPRPCSDLRPDQRGFDSVVRRDLCPVSPSRPRLGCFTQRYVKGQRPTEGLGVYDRTHLIRRGHSIRRLEALQAASDCPPRAEFTAPAREPRLPNLAGRLLRKIRPSNTAPKWGWHVLDNALVSFDFC